MKIVIDIPEEVKETFDKADDINFCFYDYNSVIGKAIRNGIPLPKEHGRLIDADKLNPRDISPEAWYSPMWGFELVDIEDAPTIIEADKEEEK